MIVFWVLTISRLDCPSKFQMSTLMFSGRHICTKHYLTSDDVFPSPVSSGEIVWKQTYRNGQKIVAEKSILTNLLVYFFVGLGRG